MGRRPKKLSDKPKVPKVKDEMDKALEINKPIPNQKEERGKTYDDGYRTYYIDKSTGRPIIDVDC